MIDSPSIIAYFISFFFIVHPPTHTGLNCFHTHTQCRNSVLRYDLSKRAVWSSSIRKQGLNCHLTTHQQSTIPSHILNHHTSQTPSPYNHSSDSHMIRFHVHTVVTRPTKFIMIESFSSLISSVVRGEVAAPHHLLPQHTTISLPLQRTIYGFHIWSASQTCINTRPCQGGDLASIPNRGIRNRPPYNRQSI